MKKRKILLFHLYLCDHLRCLDCRWQKDLVSRVLRGAGLPLCGRERHHSTQGLWAGAGCRAVFSLFSHRGRPQNTPHTLMTQYRCWNCFFFPSSLLAAFSFASRPFESMKCLAFVLQSPRCKPVCIHVPEVICFMLGVSFAQKQKAVSFGAFNMLLFYTWCCWVKPPAVGQLLQGSHIWELSHLFVPPPQTGLSTAHCCVKTVAPGKNLAKMPTALCITCVENESSSVEHALLANGILHPIYLLLPSFKITWLCQMHS